MALVWLFKVVFLRGMGYDGGKGECVVDATLWKTLQTPLFALWQHELSSSSHLS